MDKRFLIVFGVACSLTVGYATGHIQSKVEFEARHKELGTPLFERLAHALQDKLERSGGKVPEAEKIGDDAIGNFAEAVGKMLDKPEGYDVAYLLALNEYEWRTATEDSTARIEAAAAKAQVELQIMEIEQNRKIIGLLEKMSKP